jgi:ubiquinone/menaquinone biosynthesis C-methylase UbiE
MGLIFDEQIARTYESWYHSPQGRAMDRAIEPFILALIDPGLGERVLDIGCGSGNHLITLSKLGMNASGLDASPHMIARARRRIGHTCNLKVGMAEDLPFEDNEFDLAMLINTLEFLDHPLQALREAGRVANRKVFIGVINSLSWNGFMKRVQGYLGDPLFCQSRFYNLWQLKSLIQKAYGRVPLRWGCKRIRPSFVEETDAFEAGPFEGVRSPFGYFLGISATLAYRIKADNLPLRIKLKQASHSLLGAKTFGDLNRKKGVC